MPSITANPGQMDTRSRVIVFVVYPEIKLLDLAGPLQAFADAVDDAGNTRYTTEIISSGGGFISTDTPVTLSTEPLSDWKNRHIDTLIVVGGRGAFTAMNDSCLLADIKQLANNSRRTGSICSGAFVLAACGLLDGRRAVTHWQYCDRLAATFPLIRVEANPIFINDENLWTSAGVTAGIDMTIKMISQDLGRSAGLSLARSLVTYLVRPGGQSQFSDVLALQSADTSGRFEELHQWILNNLTKDLLVEQLADHVSMSPRNFARAYLAHTGRTPAKAVEAFRVEAARRMLEDGMLSVSAVAIRCGFGDDERMRRSFLRLLEVSPQSYRNRF